MTAAPACLSLATPADREQVYAARHAVYAAELGQHAVHPGGRLTDALDAFNDYVVARRGDRVIGFVSLTPPGPGRYSVDKYVDRAALPFPVDAGLHEVRLLTVLPGERHGPVAAALMLAALRLVEARGGTRVVAIGRREVLGVYRKAGLDPHGPTFASGAVSFTLMSATVADLRARLDRLRRPFARALRDCRWDLPVPPAPTAPCFHGGRSIRELGPALGDLHRRSAVVNADVLDAPFDPAPGVVEVLRGEAAAWLARTSPPAACDPLVAAVAAARGVPPECVVPAAGSSDLIFRAFLRWLTPAARVLLPEPTYGEYAHVLARVIGCRVDRLRLGRDHGYALTADALRAATGRRQYDLVVLVNPNSPTGRHTPRDELAGWVAGLPPATRVWVDETYVDYVGPAASLEPLAAAGGNVVVCKSMSKAYALSGLRVGYAVGPAGLMADLRSVTPPWAVGLPAQVAAVRALADPGYYAAQHRAVGRRREALGGALAAAVGCDVVPGVANFLLAHLPDDGPDAAAVVAACERRGVYLRDVSDDGRVVGRHAVRVAVKGDADNAAIVDALRGAAGR